MNVNKLFESESEAVISAATKSLWRSHLEHYEEGGAEVAEERLQALYDLLLQCLRRQSAMPINRYAEDIAQQRFHGGFELFEIQTAFNVLEEAIWKRMATLLEPGEFAWTKALVGTILGNGKDALARTYVQMASKHRTTSLDTKALFAGTGG
jgi:hypothetical protein